MLLFPFHPTSEEYADEQTLVYHDRSDCPDAKKFSQSIESTEAEAAVGAKSAHGSTALRRLNSRPSSGSLQPCAGGPADARTGH
jgi:hypothetical protein